ncbi:murein hydrolase activator EnvC family protein [Variovorax sp. PAMC 28711]|uniref:murein hydrolase activator EnvC family protein n=1 Tax=Variovorax sp. PAMC 28711 TaxID=1795631 RepID=UPI00078C2D82|nr:peptidoglycan DD-metalloendopeptidase family protein [Variovorax sp. PAMC 28711]AMM23132.1 peptidase M23 [Variovorax sp. PAMC 28711]
MQPSTLVIRTGLVLIAAAALVACQTTPLPSNAPSVQPVPGVPAPKPPSAFIRPANGPTIARFDGNQSKGLDIAGNQGDPVVASRDGRVVIVSDALRQYGTMIIVKHDETYLTAYANLDRALVKENDVVRQGQKIAEMGKSGTDRVKLHFEVRKKGVAVNPEPYLDGRAR